jgi:hypothetical protein
VNGSWRILFDPLRYFHYTSPRRKSDSLPSQVRHQEKVSVEPAKSSRTAGWMRRERRGFDEKNHIRVLHSVTGHLRMHEEGRAQDRQGGGLSDVAAEHV